MPNCRFCKRERLDSQATWCPTCGSINPLGDAPAHHLSLKSVDMVQTPDAGQHQFFVCQNPDCNWPVMSLEAVVKQRHEIRHRVIDTFKGRRALFFWLSEGWQFIFTGSPATSLQEDAISNWRTAFCCPNCQRPVFYRKHQAEMMPDEQFDTVARGRGLCLVMQIVLAIPMLYAALLTVGTVYLFKIDILVAMMSLAFNIYIVCGILLVCGVAGFYLSHSTAFRRAEEI